jgi:hypothetical protein
VAGQGLDVSADNLGAGADATANEFEQFESALELATTGGRGRCAANWLQPACTVLVASGHSVISRAHVRLLTFCCPVAGKFELQFCCTECVSHGAAVVCIHA